MAKFKENLYELLNVKEDCTSKEIKQSFIELSKKYHPDKSDNKDFHKIFVKINEAYGILGKPSSRRQYDQHLVDNRDRPYVHYYDDIYTTRQKRTNFGYEPYYSIKGLKKMPNSVIVALCLFITAVGAGVEFLTIRKSFTFDRERLQHDSARNHLIWQQARATALENGNENQIKKFKDGELRGESISHFNNLYANTSKNPTT